MQYKSFSTSSYSLLSHAIQLTHSRSTSRLNSVFLTFAKTPEATKKVCNDLYLLPSQDLRAHLTVGERRFPATEDL